MAESFWDIMGRLRQGGGGKPVPSVTEPTPGASAQYPLTAPGGKPGQWFQGSRLGQFGHPDPAQIPANIGEIRTRMQGYENRPTGFPLNQIERADQNMWQGVFNLPEPTGPFNLPNPNMGSRMASVPGGEQGPSAPWGDWQPAQAEQTSRWRENMYT